MTFKDSLHIVTTDFIFKLIFPDKAMVLTKRMQRTKRAFEELRVCLDWHSSITVHLYLPLKSFTWWRWSKNVSVAIKFSVMIYSAIFWRPMTTPLMLPLYPKMSLSVCGLQTFHSSFIKLYCRQHLHLPRCWSWGSNLSPAPNKAVWYLLSIQTTAHTLCFTFAMLALYPEEQERLFEHIKSVIPDGQKPVRANPPIVQEATNADTKRDIWTNALVDILFGRLLRNAPTVSAGPYISHSEVCCTCVTWRQVTAIPKIPTEDTSLVTRNIHGEKCTIPISKDVDITISVPGLHYNRMVAYLPYHVVVSLYRILARYWEDPHAFKPSRFLGDWPRDAFLPFSAGKPFHKVGW